MKAQDWINMREEIASKAISCHDCRYLRNKLLVLMDELIGEAPFVITASAKEHRDHLFDPAVTPPISGPLAAHSEVEIKEPLMRVTDRDGIEVKQETTKKVL